MPKTTASLEDYEVLATIGTGSFGTCQKIQRKSDKKVFVWKEIDYGGMSEREKQLLVQEVNLLRELRHPHIVRYHDRVISKSLSTLYIIMEYCQGGDLAALIAKAKKEKFWLEEKFVWRVFYQLLLALQECYRQRQGVHKVLHRDIKPANVFLDSQGQVKLGDFGMARILHHNFSLAKTFVGTPYYMSPELLREQSYDEKSDLWSLGCLIYELCALVPPFLAPSQKVLAVRIKLGHYRRIPAHYSDELQSAVASLIQTEPSLRPDIAAMLQRVSPGVRVEAVQCRKPLSPSELGRQRVRLEEKERDLARKEMELQEKEAELVGRERSLVVQEKALLEKERQLKKCSIIPSMYYQHRHHKPHHHH